MTFATAVPILFASFVHRTNVYWSFIQGIKKKTTFIGAMELVSLRFNRDFTSKYVIATQWYQFHTTDKCVFFLNKAFKKTHTSGWFQ